jgi:hypothetical protein
LVGLAVEIDHAVEFVSTGCRATRLGFIYEAMA